MTLNRDRRQVRANAHAIKRMDDASKPIFERVSRTALLPGDANSTGGESSTSIVRRAVTKENAPSDNTIICNLYNSDGVEITTGTDGVDYNIPVTCNISGGSALNEAVPRLESGDSLFVAKVAGVSYCVSNFQASEDCTCGS